MIVLRLFTVRLFLAVGALLAIVAVLSRSISTLHRAEAIAPRNLVPSVKTTPTEGIAYARSGAARSSSMIRGCFVAEFDPTSATAHGRAPLLIATLTQSWRQMNDLLKAGAAATAADDAGLTPLMVAAAHGSVEAIQALLGAGAPLDVTDRSGRTALHRAIIGGHLSAVKLLLTRTSGSELRPWSERDLLDVAFETGNWQILQPVLEHVSPALEWTDPALRVLQRTLRDGDVANLRLLLSRELQPPPLQNRTVPLLAHAIVTGDAPVFQMLLNAGADPNTTLPTPPDKRLLEEISSNYLRQYVETDSGISVLMLAAGLGKAEFVRALLECGADRNRSTAHDKMLALYFATRSKTWQGTQMLLGRGPAPEELRIEISLAGQTAAVIKNGQTIFRTACSTGRDGHSTPAGYYVITDKDRDHRSTIYKVTMPFFMRLNCRDFGMHAGVVANPHASHGCVRLPLEAAQKLFAGIPVGTVVAIN